jgi:hypothetical protein
MANGTDNGNGQHVVRTAVKSEVMAWITRAALLAGTGAGGWIGTHVIDMLQTLASKHEAVGKDVVDVKHSLELLESNLKWKITDQDRSITDLRTQTVDHENRLRELERPQAALSPVPVQAPRAAPRPSPVPAPLPPPAKPANFLDGLFGR